MTPAQRAGLIIKATGALEAHHATGHQPIAFADCAAIVIDALDLQAVAVDCDDGSLVRPSWADYQRRLPRDSTMLPDGFYEDDRVLYAIGALA